MSILATTSPEGLHPLGSPAQRSYELVTGAVASRLGADHAAIFAEPVAAQHGHQIDWHSPVDGRAVPLEALDAAEAEEVKSRLDSLLADIGAEAERLAASDRPDDQRLAEALSHAARYPGEDMIRAVRDGSGALHPVLIHWSWTRAEARAVRGALSRTEARPAPAAPVETRGQAARASLWWLLIAGWALLAILLGAILWLTLAPCALSLWGPRFCPGSEPEIAVAVAERAVLADTVVTLERGLALLDRGCQPTVPLTPALPPDAAPEEDETNAVPLSEPEETQIAELLDQRGAKRGALNFALTWTTTDDVDLYVTCPAGLTLFFSNRSGCGGVYDLDANADSAGAIGDPAENVVFQTPQPGIYQVRAHLRSDRSGTPTEVTLHVLRQDGPSLTYKGMLGAEQDDWTKTISISR